MKTTILLAALAALTCPIWAQDKVPAVAAKATTAPIAETSKLNPVHAAKWKEINDSIRDMNEKAEKAELAYFRAKESRDKSVSEGNAAFVKMQAEANCPSCFPQAAADGSLSWMKPAEKK